MPMNHDPMRVAGQAIFCVEKQPNFEGGPVPGIWETLDVFSSEQGAQGFAGRIREAYKPEAVILRVTKRTVRDD